MGGVKKKDCKAVFGALQGLVVSALKSHGKFVIPGVSMVKLRHKKATPAGKRMAFGKEIKVKAKPACKVVKSSPRRACVRTFEWDSFRDRSLVVQSRKKVKPFA